MKNATYDVLVQHTLLFPTKESSMASITMRSRAGGHNTGSGAKRAANANHKRHKSSRPLFEQLLYFREDARGGKERVWVEVEERIWAGNVVGWVGREVLRGRRVGVEERM